MLKKNDIQLVKDIKNFNSNSTIRYVNSNSVCIKTKINQRNKYSRLFGIIQINIQYEWTDQNYSYLILNKNDFEKIKTSYDDIMGRIRIPGFVIEDGRMIVGYKIIDMKNTKQYVLFGANISKILSLFYCDNTNKDLFVIQPISYPSENDKELYVDNYNDIDFYNEEIVNRTILRSVEELFNDEDEDQWI